MPPRDSLHRQSDSTQHIDELMAEIAEHNRDSRRHAKAAARYGMLTAFLTGLAFLTVVVILLTGNVCLPGC